MPACNTSVSSDLIDVEEIQLRAMLADRLDVERALDESAMVPYFQPIVELHSGRIAGFELLARWKHPEHGAVLPENFISLVEEHRLAGRLMEQILRKALRAAKNLPESLMLAVNVSATQLLDALLPEQIRKAADEFEFSLDRLTVEITESALVENLEQATRVVERLKAMGCKLALDDFGAGYSSLHLRSLPFDEMKIDRSFVSTMTSRRESRKMVAAMVGLGHSLDLTTVAEGVETEEQAEMLLWLGCRMGQGWLYGPPVQEEEIAAMLNTVPRRVSAKASQSGLLLLDSMPTQRLAQLQAIYDGAPVGLGFVDPELHYVSLNQHLAELNGVAVEDHLGKTIPEIIPELYPTLAPYLEKAFRGEPVENLEVKRRSPKADSDLTMLLSYHPTRDEAGEVTGISVVMVDITARKQMEALMQEREENYRHLLELTLHAPWICDAEGHNLEVSPRWLEITGMTDEEVRKRGWMQKVHPEDRQRTTRTLEESLANGEPIDLEYRVLHATGEWRWMRSYGGPRYGPDGKIMRWYGSVWDIHDLKVAKEEVAALRSELAELKRQCGQAE